MRIATWNLDHASNSSRPIGLQVEKILSIKPDILVLTETCSQVDLSPHGYVCIASLPNDYGKFYSAIHLGSRIAIKRNLPTYDPITATCVHVDTPLGEMFVYGTIITYHGDKGANGDSPAWSEHYKAITDHGNDWHRLGNDVPIIVAGDFNQTRDGSTRSYGTKRGREMLSAAFSRNRLICLTTEDFGKKGMLNVDPRKALARHNIDHICMTQDVFDVTEVGAWDHFTDEGRYLSDHNGVYVDIERRR